MITIVGLGALGTRVCANIPKDADVLLIDFDIVREENIPGQYPEEVIGMSKGEAARILWLPKAQVINKHIDVTTVNLLHNASVVIDCTDNMLTRYIINDFCTKEGIPWVHAAISDTAGTVATFIPDGPCFSCIYPNSKGEHCSRNFNRAVADHTASVAAFEAQELLKEPKTKFARIGPTNLTVFTIEKRAGCETCNGKYPYLATKPQSFYITYCTNAQCMAAKPLKHVHHDHGAAKEITVRGTNVRVYNNGELHFDSEADDDELFAIAEEVYRQFKFL